MGALTYRWRRGTIPLFDDGRITGATTPTLTIHNVGNADVGTDYNVLVTAGCGDTVVSTSAALTIAGVTAADAGV